MPPATEEPNTTASSTTMMIDEIYEFSAPRFFDFIKGETDDDKIKAELWFDSATAYAPSRIAQHHDAVTGTSKLHTTSDYAKRLFIGASEAEAVVSAALSCLTIGKSGEQCKDPALTFSQCQLLNISYCPPTEEGIPEGKSLVVVAYNPLGWNRTDNVRIPVRMYTMFRFLAKLKM